MPSDDDRHTFVTSHTADFEYHALVLPRGHVTDILVSEHHAPRFEAHRVLNPHDLILQDAITRAFDACGHEDDGLVTRADAAARRLLVRLTELRGGGKPAWHDDASVFDRRTIPDIVSSIDDNLRIAPAHGDVCRRTGVSPSHVAKKFRRNTGLSLHRFVNRRRILRSLETLKGQLRSFAGIAIDLGFSSRSHCTRLFSGLMGMTTAKHQNNLRRTVG